MAKILSIAGNQYKIGCDNGEVATVSAASIQYTGAKVGDNVELFKDGENYIVMKKGTQSASANDDEVPVNGKKIDKNIFVWVGTFLFGIFGVDRFMRGQIGLGVFKLLVGWWISAGIWPLVDWIIAMKKAYGPFANSDSVIFDNIGKYTK